jgi:hypothetical protein
MYSDSGERVIAPIIEGRNAIAARYCVHVRQLWYIAGLPEYRNGKQYGDFEYSESGSKAIPLSPYWQRRIRTIVRDCSTHDSITFLAIANEVALNERPSRKRGVGGTK